MEALINFDNDEEMLFQFTASQSPHTGQFLMTPPPDTSLYTQTADPLESSGTARTLLTPGNPSISSEMTTPSNSTISTLKETQDAKDIDAIITNGAGLGESLMLWEKIKALKVKGVRNRQELASMENAREIEALQRELGLVF